MLTLQELSSFAIYLAEAKYLVITFFLLYLPRFIELHMLSHKQDF